MEIKRKRNQKEVVVQSFHHRCGLKVLIVHAGCCFLLSRTILLPANYTRWRLGCTLFFFKRLSHCTFFLSSPLFPSFFSVLILTAAYSIDDNTAAIVDALLFRISSTHNKWIKCCVGLRALLSLLLPPLLPPPSPPPSIGC